MVKHHIWGIQTSEIRVCTVQNLDQLQEDEGIQQQEEM